MKMAIDHISVCVCTFKRPRLLEQLLLALSNQTTVKSFRYSVVVVDNDRLQSARNVVETFGEKTKIDITYVNESEQNISLARNQAVRNAKGNYLAFIDDDESPEHDWLLKLYNICTEYNADGVLGPVKARYESDPPLWILKGRMHEKGNLKTGEIIRKSRDTRTSNVLLRMQVFRGMENPFNVRYGRTGGEDVDFFRRMMQEGCVFVWCNEAPVYETIPPERMKRTYFMKRALLRGAVAAKSQPSTFFGTSKSILAFILYILALPFLQLLGHHIFMKYLVKSCDHIGKLLAIIGIDVVKERTW